MLDLDYTNPVRRYAWKPFGPGMRICPNEGIAYQVDRSVSVDYGQEYFDKYVKYEGSPIALALCHARNNLVSRYCRCVLDIGIGSGEFLKRAAVKCYGYDISEPAIAWLKERRLFADPYHIVPRDVQGITLWDVLEHLPNPARLLRKISPGMFVFVSIPIWRDLTQLRDSKHFRPNEHYWYFTDAGLQRFMQDQGFDCVETNDEETRAGREDIQSYAFLRCQYGDRALSAPTVRKSCPPEAVPAFSNDLDGSPK
jgi:hypothetical protein